MFSVVVKRGDGGIDGIIKEDCRGPCAQAAHRRDAALDSRRCGRGRVVLASGTFVSMLRILLGLCLVLVSWAVVVGTAFDKDWVFPTLWVCPVIAMAAAWRAPKLQMAILLPLVLLTLLDVALKLRSHDYGPANGGYDDAGEAAAFMFHIVLAVISIGLGVVGFLISLVSYNKFRKDGQIASP